VSLAAPTVLNKKVENVRGKESSSIYPIKESRIMKTLHNPSPFFPFLLAPIADCPPYYYV
jgi:hypothetical protein